MCHVTCGNAELRKVGSRAAPQPASPAAPVLRTKLFPIRTRNEPSKKCDKIFRPSRFETRVRGPTDTVRLSSSAEGSGGADADEDAARGPECFRGENRKANFLENAQVETYSFTSLGREHVDIFAGHGTLLRALLLLISTAIAGGPVQRSGCTKD
jgi:hypothetical protein